MEIGRGIFMEKTIEEIEKEIEAQQELYMKAKAEAEAK